MRACRSASLISGGFVSRGLALGMGVICIIGGCGKTESETKTSPKTADETSRPAPNFVELRPRIEKFCGDCHAVPDPATFPKRAWYDEVAQGYRFYDDSRRQDLDPPPMRDVVAYYQHFAPEKLTTTVFPQVEPHPRVTFTPRTIPSPAKDQQQALSNLYWHPSAKNGKGEILFCDMRSGEVRRLDPLRPDAETELLARLHHPAHLEAVKFDKDDPPGFVVAELGSFLPGDHEKGRVSWLRQRPEGTGYETTVLSSGFGRVADVRPADFDGDGRIDLIVAEFGWRRTGRILLLRQTGRKEGVPVFETIVIDKRHGTIHVPVVDLNRDGRPDFVALISQEHEAIEAFLNTGNGTFQKQRIYQFPDPSFGSSGIQVIDFDGDGDLDVLYTNGDSLDSHYLKPYHAVHWLENQGGFPFVHHEITRLPGVSSAVVRDLDGDGDLDIACVAYLPANIIDEHAGGQIDSLIWLEQQPKGKFVRHVIERSSTGYLCLIAHDFDGNGTVDLAAGHFSESATRSCLTVWSNGPSRAAPEK